MSMFKELFQLALGATLTLTISADEKQGRMTVNVIPKPKTDAGEPALSTPLTLTARPEEFDADFVGVLARYRSAHASLTQQAQVTQELLDAAKAASAKKGAGAVAKASVKAAPAPAATKRTASTARAIDDADDVHDDDSGDEGSDAAGGAAEQSAVTVAPAPQRAAKDPEPQLFG